MIPSVIINAVIFLINIVCVVYALKKMKPGPLFRYFTVLSNLFCALASACVVVAWLACGTLPLWAVLMKYTGTVAVTITLLTVFIFLAPSSGEWKKLLSGADLFWHLLCPFAAIVSFCVFEHTRFGFGWVLLGVLTVILYGAFYLYRVALAPESQRMEDFYGFNKAGRWYISVLLMTLGAFVVSVVLWAV